MIEHIVCQMGSDSAPFETMEGLPLRKDGLLSSETKTSSKFCIAQGMNYQRLT